MISFAAALLLSSFSSAAGAPARPAAPAKLAATIEKSKHALDDVEVRQRSVLSALYQLNRKIHKTVSEKAKLKNERASLEDNVRRLSERLKDLDGESASLRARLGERLKAIHRLGGPSLARVLSAASSASSLDRNLKILGLVAARDRNLVVEYRMLREEVKTKHVKLAGRLQRLQEIETGLHEREKKFIAEQQVKNRILNGIRKKKLFAEKNLAELRRRTIASGAIADDAVLDLLFRPSFADEKGKLEPPVRGAIVRRFGSEKTSDQFWTVSRKGMRFAAAAGAPVKAVFDGVVAWTGEIPGFGRSLIVDHGDHYYTVYSNAGEVRVSAGEEVRREQIVATAGSAALEDGNGLYFEIRHFSEPDDPQFWLKGTAL